MNKNRKIKVIATKPGLDGHDRGIKVVAHALRDSGMEVIYTGLHQTPEDIVNAVIQEDPDVLALSLLSGAHNTLCPMIMKLLKKNNIDDILVVVGGIIPKSDISFLQEHGLTGFFGPGTPLQKIVKFIKSNLKR